MIRVDETDPVGEVDLSFPYREVVIKRNVDAKEYYDLESEIGRGKFGTVYRCRDKANGLELAAKFVPVARKEDRRNVEREVDIMRQLQHPRLIQLYDAFDCGKIMVVVLELIEGGELFERVIDDDFVLTEKSCTVFMRQICEGVEYVHRQNILHLDMKPENILCLTKTGNRIKIIDFGLARKFDPNKKLQVLFGTPEFVAPEVVNFEQIGFETDMWSVGVICYVLLSGLSPFMGETDVETMANVTIAKYDFEDEAFDEISTEAKDFIMKLLIKDKKQRMSASECLEHAWLRRKPPAPAPPLSLLLGLHHPGLDMTKDNLRLFVERWAEHPNSPYVFDVSAHVISPLTLTAGAQLTSSQHSLRGMSPSPCGSLTSSPDSVIEHDAAASPPDHDGAFAHYSFSPFVQSPRSPNTLRPFQDLQAFERRASDSSGVVRKTDIAERINLAEEIRKLSDKLFKMSTLPDFSLSDTSNPSNPSLVNGTSQNSFSSNGIDIPSNGSGQNFLSSNGPGLSSSLSGGTGSNSPLLGGKGPNFSLSGGSSLNSPLSGGKGPNSFVSAGKSPNCSSFNGPGQNSSLSTGSVPNSPLFEGKGFNSSSFSGSGQSSSLSGGSGRNFSTSGNKSPNSPSFSGSGQNVSLSSGNCPNGFSFNDCSQNTSLSLGNGPNCSSFNGSDQNFPSSPGNDHNSSSFNGSGQNSSLSTSSGPNFSVSPGSGSNFFISANKDSNSSSFTGLAQKSPSSSNTIPRLTLTTDTSQNSSPSGTIFPKSPLAPSTIRTIPKSSLIDDRDPNCSDRALSSSPNCKSTLTSLTTGSNHSLLNTNGSSSIATGLNSSLRKSPSLSLSSNGQNFFQSNTMGHNSSSGTMGQNFSPRSIGQSSSSPRGLNSSPRAFDQISTPTKSATSSSSGPSSDGQDPLLTTTGSNLSPGGRSDPSSSPCSSIDPNSPLSNGPTQNFLSTSPTGSSSKESENGGKSPTQSAPMPIPQSANSHRPPLSPASKETNIPWRRTKFRVTGQNRDVPLNSYSKSTAYSESENGISKTQVTTTEKWANSAVGTKDLLLKLLDKWDDVQEPLRTPGGRHKSISAEWSEIESLGQRTISSLNTFFQSRTTNKKTHPFIKTNGVK